MEITRITGDNRECFRSLLTEDMEEKLSLPGYYGIGALTGKRPRLTLAGTLVFHVRKSLDGDSDYAELEWLCVSEAQRRQGIGAALLRELSKALLELGAESFYADLPVEGFHELKDFFRSEGLQSTIMETPVFEDSAEHLRKSLQITDSLPAWEEDSLCSLGEMDPPRVKKQLWNSIYEMPVQDQEEIFQKPFSYYDPEVSTIHLSGGVADAFLLIHEAPSGLLVVEYYGSSEEAPAEASAAVLSEAINAVIEKFGRAAHMIFPLKSEEGEEMLGLYLPHLLPRTVMRFATPAKKEAEEEW